MYYRSVIQIYTWDARIPTIGWYVRPTQAVDVLVGLSLAEPVIQTFCLAANGFFFQCKFYNLKVTGSLLQRTSTPSLTFQHFPLWNLPVQDWYATSKAENGIQSVYNLDIVI